MQGGAAYDYCHNVFSKLMAFDTMYICNGQLCITRYYFIQISMIFIVLALTQRACRLISYVPHVSEGSVLCSYVHVTFVQPNIL